MPVVTRVSHATRPCGSWRITSSRMESEIWSATLSGCPSVTDSDVNRREFRSLMEGDASTGRRVGQVRGRAERSSRNAVEERRQGVQSGLRGGPAAVLQAAGQRGDHSPSPPGPGDGERDLRAVEAGDQPVRELHRAARPPGVADRRPHHRPVADEVMELPVDLHGVQPALGGDVEVVGAAKPLGQTVDLPAGHRHRLDVGGRQTPRRLGLGLGDDRHRDGAVESLLEVAEEAVADAEELLRGRSRDRHRNAGLEPPPELPKIAVHDYQSSEPAAEGYAAPAAK